MTSVIVRMIVPYETQMKHWSITNVYSNHDNKSFDDVMLHTADLRTNCGL